MCKLIFLSTAIMSLLFQEIILLCLFCKKKTQIIVESTAGIVFITISIPYPLEGYF